GAGAPAGRGWVHAGPNFRRSVPTKVVEYMARGVPVVTTPLPAAAELARGHECGFVVPFGDPAAAADAVLELDRDFSLRAKMGRRGHEAAYSSLGWPSDAREFVAQLESRSEEHTSELQSLTNLVCRLLLEKKKKHIDSIERKYTLGRIEKQRVLCERNEITNSRQRYLKKMHIRMSANVLR